MRKLSLNPEQLRVESFPMQAPATARGTVAAHAPSNLGCPTDPPACGTQMRVQSCYASCTDVEFCGAF
jgi:hypothetical protein